MRIAVTLALALCAEASAQPSADAPTSVLVKLTPAAAARVAPGAAARSGLQAFDAVAARFGVAEFRRVFRTDPRHAARHAAYGLGRWYLVALPGPADVPAAAAFGALEDVEAAEANAVVRIPSSPVLAPEPLAEEAGRQGAGAAVVNDPRYPEQWHYHNTGQMGGTPGMDIDLPEAWALATGSARVVVHINDSGIDGDHVDLAAALWTNAGEVPDNGIDDDGNGYVDDVHGWNYVADTNNPDDDAGHGTHCAGTIGAVTNNGVGVAGIAGGSGSGDGVRLMATKFIVASTGSGSLSDWAAGVTYAADNGAVISSNSVSHWLTPTQFVRDAIDYFSDNAGGPGA
ncbi:MAG TPA: subtilase family N-terminal domain-containing protein, partial [Longimicrobium sp.]